MFMGSYFYFETRDEARIFCGANGIVQSAIEKNKLAWSKRNRWMIPTRLIKSLD